MMTDIEIRCRFADAQEVIGIPLTNFNEVQEVAVISLHTWQK